MRIAVVSDLAPGSHKAYAINVVKTAGGMARLGHEVTVYCRKPEPEWTIDLARQAYAEPEVRFETYPSPDQADEQLTSERYLRAFALWASETIARRGAGLVFARHTRGALACLERGLPTILETHMAIEDDWAGGHTCLRAASATGPLLGVVTIGAPLRDRYVSLGAATERVRIVPDAVDAELFGRPRELPQPPYGEGRKPRVLYAGHLYDYKGVPTLLEAAALMPEVDVHLLGGTDQDVACVRERARKLPNVRVHGRVAHAEVPYWLWYADVLVLPPSATHPSAAWTSPVKLGEYVASETPIVASRIPALRAWVGEPIVRWFEPDDARSLAEAVRRTLDARVADGERERVREARAWTRRFSYVERARAILEHAEHGRVRAAA